MVIVCFVVFAHQLCGSDQQHCCAQHYIEKNAKYYKPLWIGRDTWIGGDTFSIPVNQIKLTGVRVPVYVALLDTKGIGIYCWNLFKPHRMDIEDSINGPGLPIYPFTVKHTEMAPESHTRNHDIWMHWDLEFC